MLRSQHRVYDGSGEVARTQDVWGAEGISGRVKFLPLAWAGMPKTSFRKNSDSPLKLYRRVSGAPCYLTKFRDSCHLRSPWLAALEVRLEQVCCEESEVDEQWSFVGNKSNQRWLWHAVDHKTNTVLAYVFGKRKRNTQKIERKNLNFRTWIKRLTRRTICFSKLDKMHDIVIGLLINKVEFGRNIHAQTQI